uniref:RNA-directed DNA polymerase, eukaryota, reverse transcriptase zinc-binding domain protein n=1 Tax=Tanacetum cinerariifolium TaxID=118510 RepID=A0A699HLH2_TANCI|nr:RNA-directed DNA polymerase, eukaryota, reverse transcriptase zinc-binding domain protein [Tanacetum cinerariifolium]
MERGFLDSGGRKSNHRKKTNTVTGIGLASKSVKNPCDTSNQMESFPPLLTHVTTSAGNAIGKSSYANVTGKSNRKKLNIHTPFTLRGNGIDVVVPVDSIRAISNRFANTSYGFFLWKRVAYPVVANYVRNC